MGNNPMSGVIFAIEEACKMSACKVIQIKIMMSILIDTEKQRNIDLQEVNAGLMPEWKYKVKWQGMSEEEAKREVAENSDEGIEYDDDEDDDTEEDVNVN